MPKTGRAYDLSSGWWPGMPLAAGHPPFHVMTYRTPAGERNQKDLRFLDQNRVNFGFVSEFMMGTTHTGTHIDALAHITCGPHAAWHGGYSSSDYLGDFGRSTATHRNCRRCSSAASSSTFPAALGVKHLAPHQPVGGKELAAPARARTWRLARAISSSSAPARCSTGRVPRASPPARAAACRSTAQNGWRGRVSTAFAGDNAALEVAPVGHQGRSAARPSLSHPRARPPHPGMGQPEELARDRVYEFLFVCLPLPGHRRDRIDGAAAGDRLRRLAAAAARRTSGWK